MARTKAEKRYITLPNPLPDGLTLAKVTRTEGEGDAKQERIAQVLMIEESAAGIVALQKLVNENKKEKDADGNTFVARTLNALLAKDAEVNDGKIEFLVAPKARVLDPMEAFLARQKEFIVAHKRPPTGEETSKMYAEIFG